MVTPAWGPVPYPQSPQGENKVLPAEIPAPHTPRLGLPSLSPASRATASEVRLRSAEGPQGLSGSHASLHLLSAPDVLPSSRAFLPNLAKKKNKTKKLKSPQLPAGAPFSSPAWNSQVDRKAHPPKGSV